MFRYKRLAIFYFIFISLSVYSNDFQGLSYKIETNAAFSHGQNSPFWLTANRYGLSSIKSNWGLMRVGADYSKQIGKNWKIKGGIDIASMYNSDVDLFIQQAYADISYKRLFLSIGKKENEPYIINPRLSTGDLIEGINSRPIPQVKIGLNSYSNIPFTNSWAKIKGYFSFGWFTDNDWQKNFVRAGGIYTKNVLVHRKELFMKFGKLNKFPLEVEVGFNRATRFKSFSDHIKVLFGKDKSRRTLFGENNQLFNKIGSWNFAITLKLNDYLIKTYYQHLFNGVNGLSFKYGAWRDGLLGISLKNSRSKWISEVIFELLKTKRQTTNISNENWYNANGILLGRDNYYNNDIYLAWQHYGMGIANPLITSPIYNDNKTISFQNNRIEGYHIGISGNPSSEIEYRALITLTHNYGTYENPYSKGEKQFSSMLEVSYSPNCMKGWTFSGALAYDNGKLIGDNFGGMISIKKAGNINFNCSRRN